MLKVPPAREFFFHLLVSLASREDLEKLRDNRQFFFFADTSNLFVVFMSTFLNIFHLSPLFYSPLLHIFFISHLIQVDQHSLCSELICHFVLAPVIVVLPVQESPPVKGKQ